MLWNWKFKLSTRPGARSASARWLVGRAVLAASIVAALLVAGHYLVQQSLAEQENARTIVGIAGRQRMLGQRIAKSALMIQAARPGPDRQHLAIELRQLLDLWSRYQMGLSLGDEELALPTEQSVAIDSMYSDLHAVYVAIDSAGKCVVEAGRGGPENRVDDRSLHKSVADIQKFERRFLEGMDRIVHQYEAESRAQVSQLRWMERALLAFALGALPLAGWWVLRPTVQQLHRNAQELADLRQQLHTAGLASRPARSEPVPVERPTRSDLPGKRPTFRAWTGDIAGREADELVPMPAGEFAPADAVSLVVALQAAVEREDQVALGRLMPRLLAQLECSALGEQAAAAAAEVQRLAAGRDRLKIAQALDQLQRRLKQPAASLTRETRPAAAVA